MNKLSIAFLTVLFSLAVIIPVYADDEQPSPFSDIELGDKYYDAAVYLDGKGIIEGYDDGTLRPSQEVNRVEALKMILESAGIECEAGETEIEFNDIEIESWYYKYLWEGVDRNIIEGYKDGTFKPEDTINLSEALKMIVNANQLVSVYPESAEDFFADADAEAWYAKYINFASENGLIYPDSGNNIEPGKTLTRADLIYIIYRQETAAFSGNIEYGQATYYGNIFEGMGTASGEPFDETEMTAAHKTLPFGTYVRVTNLANNQTVEVKINDRGPYGEGRIIDLSKSAFKEIGALSTGVLNVEVEIIYP